MNITNNQTLQLFMNTPTFEKFSFTLLVNRLRRIYGANPCEEVLTQSTEEINYFLEKYYLAMAPDFEYIQANYSVYEALQIAA